MSGVHTMEGRASLSHRLGLGIILLFQITIIPIIGFSLTYLIKIDRENFGISIRAELFQWIIISGLTYGIICLVLALIIGVSDHLQLLKEVAGFQLWDSAKEDMILNLLIEQKWLLIQVHMEK